MAYIVYKHTAPNGKVYIGITKQKPKDRWQNGLGYKTQPRFYNAIRKYGWDSFVHEILFEGLTLEEAERKEKELIAQHHSRDKQFGYNIESGGNCCKEISAETRAKIIASHRTPEYLEFSKKINEKRWADPEAHRKMSERFSGKNNPMYGRKLTNEHKKILFQHNQPPPRCYGADNYWYGKHITDDMKNAISKANMGENNGRAKSVYCAESQRTYGSIRDAYRATGVNFSSISKCCNGVIRSAGGYHWRYVEDTEVRL